MDSFSIPDILLNVFGGVLIAVGIIAFIYAFWRFSDPVFNRTSLKRRRQYEKVFKRLFDGIYHGAVQNETAVRGIFESSFNTSMIRYVDFLKRFNAWIGMNTRDLTADKFNSVLKFIKPIIEKELEREDYDGLSKDDESSFSAIKSMVAKSENREAIINQLNSISKSLRNSNESVKSNGVLNKFALGVSIASILVTIGLQFFTKTSISKESIESINNNTKQQVELAVDSIKSSLVPVIEDSGKQ